MQQEFFRQLRKGISHERLEAYQERSGAGSELSLAAHYAQNIALSESLYPALQAIEIALRNSISDTLTVACKAETWFEARFDVLLPMEREGIDKARAALQRSNKEATSGRNMAELNFGFWTSLFDLRYEQRLWPLHLKNVFPYIPKGMRTRKIVSGRMNRIRRLRNRVFHHEPIWYWQDLQQQHQEILEAIGWINPSMKAFIETIDRLNEVVNLGSAFFEDRLNRIC